MPGLFFDSGIDRDFERDLARMNTKLNKFSKNVTVQGGKMDSTFRTVTKSLSGMVSVLAIGAAGKEIISFSNDLETALIEVATISQAVTDDFEGYKEALIGLSTQSATSAKDLTSAYYDIVSAGYDGAQGLELLAAAEKASTAGFVEVGIAADGLTTVLNAWGKSAEEAGAVSDIFFKTVEKGKTTFPELGQNIAQVAPIAASLGVSFEEVSAAAATLTKSGTPTAQAFTQIRSSLISVNAVLGDGWAEAMTYQEALNEVRKRAGGSSNELKKMLGRMEAVNAVLGLTGRNATTAAEDLDAMNDSLGATTIAADKVTATTAQQIAILKNNILAAFSTLGGSFNEVFGTIATKLNEAFQSGDIQRFAKFVLKLAKAFAVYKVSLIALNQIQRLRRTILLTNIKAMRLSAATGKTVTAGNYAMALSFKSIAKAFAANPIGLIVTALSLAIPAIINVAKAMESSSKKMEKITEQINKQFAEESAGLDVLQTQLSDTNLTYDEKKKLIEQLNKEYGEYLPSLLTEKSSQEDINAAIAIANDNLKEQIKLRVFNQKITESGAKVYDLEQKLFRLSTSKTNLILGDIGRNRLLLVGKQLKEEKALYQNLLGEITTLNKKAATESIIPTQGDAPDTSGGTFVDPKVTAKAARKAIEIANQERINSLTKSYGTEESLQDDLNRALLENKVRYYQDLSKLSKDQLEKLRLEEQIYVTQGQADALSALSKEQAQLEKLIEEHQGYTQKRQAIQEEYQKQIALLQKRGYEEEAAQAGIALQGELDALDDSILSANSSFQKWFKSTLPSLAKEGVGALSKELDVLNTSLQSGGLDTEQVIIYTKQIELLQKKLSNLQDPINGVNANFKDTLEIINGVNELTTTLVNSFKDMGEPVKSILTGISQTGAGVIGLANGIKLLSTSLTTLEKASAILTVVSTALQVVSAIRGVFKKRQEEREQAYLNELALQHQSNLNIIEQNRLYQEGNDLFTDDKWGTALAGLEAYNDALVYQDGLIQDLTRDGFGGIAGRVLLAKYPELVDANGKLDKEILQLILDTEKLSDADRVRLENLLEVTETAETAFSQFGDYVSGIFGGMGDEITQAFQTMYETGDDAMTSLEGSFSDMIEAFTRDAIEFAFLQPYLNELNETTKALGEQYASGTLSAEDLQTNIVDTLGDFYNSLNKVQPEILQAYENADKLAAEAGFDSAFNGDGDGALSSAGKVAQAITEETGGMLVGRMGAIMLSNERIATHSQDMLDYAIQNLVTLNKIKENTDYLPTIADNTRKTYEKLESI